jgi:starvation-inducible DNA-binding protein
LPVLPPGEQDTSSVVDLVTTQIRTTVATIREVHDEVDAEDPSTADLLHAVIDQLEKLAWLLSSENRGR